MNGAGRPSCSTSLSLPNSRGSPSINIARSAAAAKKKPPEEPTLGLDPASTGADGENPGAGRGTGDSDAGAGCLACAFTADSDVAGGRLSGDLGGARPSGDLPVRGWGATE